MIILGIETSCDETAASVIRGEGDNVEILSNVVSSQIEIHKKWGGIIPEVAAREHVLNILPVINEALEKAGLAVRFPSPPVPSPEPVRPARERGGSAALRRGEGVDVIAVTTGPGLITSLIVGVETAKTLAYAWGVPLIGANHIEGHIYANFINGGKSEKVKGKRDDFPAIILTVSGGHNLLVLMQGHGKFKIIGETLDDAAGEAFDKAAQILGLGYPGGPAISAAAEKFSISNFQFSNNDQILNFQNKKLIVKGQLSKVVLPRPMLNSKNYDFSFSGLKTALLYQVQKDKNYKNRIPEYAHEFQQAVIDTLIHKTLKAAKNYKAKTVMLAGGVSANKELRIQMAEAVKKNIPNSQFLIPDLRYTTDNAAMIACAGYFRARRRTNVCPPSGWHKIKADCNQELK